MSPRPASCGFGRARTLSELPARAAAPEVDVALVTAPVAPGHREEAAAPTRRAAEREAEAGPVLRTEDHEERPTTRTDDREGGGPTRTLKPANDNPGGATHQRVALSDTDMVTMPKAMEGSVFVHPDSRNLMAANDNFGRLINTDPTREVAIHHNPVTGEYVVIRQAGSVATSGRAASFTVRRGRAADLGRRRAGARRALDRHSLHPNRQPAP
jgi:hypothetical protein